MDKEIKVGESISVTFGKGRIAPSGEFGTMTIDQNGHIIVLTPEQARSLARTIRQRFGANGQ